MHALANKGTRISFDPNIRVELMKDEVCVSAVREVMESCSVFLPGVSELLMITGREQVDEAIKACFRNPKMEIVVLKNGSKGCSVYTREKRFSLGVYPTTVIDATGAGDCFDGAFLCALLEGRSILDAAKMASAAAALNTVAFGPMEGRISREAVFEKMENEIIGEGL